MGSNHVIRASKSRRRRLPKGQVAAPFVGAYDAIASLVHVYEPARCTLSAYSGGNLVRLRRASDDAESDFSHVSVSDPELDLAAIAAWAGGASYIVSIYDQVGGDTLTMATKAYQALFVASCKNNHAGGQFDGSRTCARGAFAGGLLSQPVTIYSVAQLDPTVVNDGNVYTLFSGDDMTNNIRVVQNPSATPDCWQVAATKGRNDGDSNGNWNVWSIRLDSPNNTWFWTNGTLLYNNFSAGAAGLDGFTIGQAYRDTDGNGWQGYITAAAICNIAHSDAQRIAMQTAMNSYWSVY